MIRTHSRLCFKKKYVLFIEMIITDKNIPEYKSLTILSSSIVVTFVLIVVSPELVSSFGT